MTQEQPHSWTTNQPDTQGEGITRDDLVAALHARGVCYLTPSPQGDERRLSDEELIIGITLAEDARLRFALAGLFLVQPHLAQSAAEYEPALSATQRAELRKQYVAAMYLQRLWRTRLRLQFGETPLISERFTAEMGLPSPDIMHGEYGLRMLCERSPYNDWSSYEQVIDLIGKQPCVTVPDEFSSQPVDTPKPDQHIAASRDHPANGATLRATLDDPRGSHATSH